MSTGTSITQSSSRSEPSLLEQYQEYLRSQKNEAPFSQHSPQAKLASLKRRQRSQEDLRPRRRQVSPSSSCTSAPKATDNTLAPASVSSSSSASSSATSSESITTRGPPRAQLTETAQQLQLSLELPGIKVSDVNVTVQHGVLVIKGHKDICSTREDEYVVTKRYKFCRRFSIDTDVVDLTSMKANLNSRGILRITAPKKRRPSRVTIPILEGEDEDIDLAHPIIIPEQQGDHHPAQHDVICNDDDDDKTVVIENKSEPV